MLLKTFFESVELHRDDKFVSLRFRRPFKVLSTSASNGGLADDLDIVFNHQCCEAMGHEMHQLMKAHRHPAIYDSLLLTEHDLAAATAAGLGTAANMNNLCIAEEQFRDLAVAAIATGGVDGNAARAGDPSSYYEFSGVFERFGPIGPDQHGTINVMLVINTPVSDGALVRAVMTATEAKTALLQELSAPSRQSSQIATGTGTDQIAVMAPADGPLELTSAGHHSKLGELIGRTVHRAVKDTLALQNGLTPIRQSSCARLLERFGCQPDTLFEEISRRLPAALAALARQNDHDLDRDPLTVAAVAALVHLHDQLSWGLLPQTCWPDIACRHGAHIAIAVAGRTERYTDYCNQLASTSGIYEPSNLATLVATALAMGFIDKWDKTLMRLDNVVTTSGSTE